MKTAPTTPPADRSTQEQTVSPRVNGKRPRLKPSAMNMDKHMFLGEDPVTNPGQEGTGARPESGAADGPAASGQ